MVHHILALYLIISYPLIKRPIGQQLSTPPSKLIPHCTLKCRDTMSSIWMYSEASSKPLGTGKILEFYQWLGGRGSIEVSYTLGAKVGLAIRANRGWWAPSQLGKFSWMKKGDVLVSALVHKHRFIPSFFVLSVERVVVNAQCSNLKNLNSTNSILHTNLLPKPKTTSAVPKFLFSILPCKKSQQLNTFPLFLWH